MFRHVLHRLRDPEQFGIAVSGVSLRAEFLAPQESATLVEQFQSPGWALDFHEAHVRARIVGPLPPGWVSLGLMRSPVESTWYGVPSRGGVLACTPAGEAIDGRITPGFTCLAAGVPLAVWEQARALAGGERAFGGATVFELPPPLFMRLERRLRATRRLLREHAASPSRARHVAQDAAGLALDLAASAWELSTPLAPARDSLRNRARLVRRAETWMREHLAEAIRVPDVCLAMRVSRRELEYAFRTVFDQSPRDFLHALRLNAVHRELRRAAPDRSILEIALAHGLTHPSRFAGEYRSFFGQAPHETRRAPAFARHAR